MAHIDGVNFVLRNVRHEAGRLMYNRRDGPAACQEV
jgi:hypothetical protein